MMVQDTCSQRHTVWREGLGGVKNSVKQCEQPPSGCGAISIEDVGKRRENMVRAWAESAKD